VFHEIGNEFIQYKLTKLAAQIAGLICTVPI